MHAFLLERNKFLEVYDALADYKNELASDEIRDMDYEEECQEYRSDIEVLAAFFHVDLSDILKEVEDRISALEESEEDDDENWSREFPKVNKLEDWEILNMFRGLLDK